MNDRENIVDALSKGDYKRAALYLDNLKGTYAAVCVVDAIIRHNLSADVVEAGLNCVLRTPSRLR